MNEKRYYTHKYLLQENKVHDKICHNFMNIDETVEHMNNQHWKYKQLKEENEQLKSFKEQNIKEYTKLKKVCNECKKENEQLKESVVSIAKEYSEQEIFIDSLQEKNKQLKQEEKRLYKYFRKCFDNVSEQGFRETWEVVKKYD